MYFMSPSHVSVSPPGHHRVIEHRPPDSTTNAEKPKDQIPSPYPLIPPQPDTTAFADGAPEAFSSASCVTRRGWRDGAVEVLSSRTLVRSGDLGCGSQDTEPVVGGSQRAARLQRVPQPVLLRCLGQGPAD